MFEPCMLKSHSYLLRATQPVHLKHRGLDIVLRLDAQLLNDLNLLIQVVHYGKQLY